VGLIVYTGKSVGKASGNPGYEGRRRPEGKSNAVEGRSYCMRHGTFTDRPGSKELRPEGKEYDWGRQRRRGLPGDISRRGRKTSADRVFRKTEET